MRPRRLLVIGLAALCGYSSVAAAAEPSVKFRATIGGPVDVVDACEGTEAGLQSEAAPLLGVVPGSPRELRAIYQAHGERVHVGAASDDGGRTWRRTAIPTATKCLGGPSDHSLSVNPLFDVGAEGVAWFGASWFNNPAADSELWSYGVDLHEWPDPAGDWRPGVIPPPPDESSQNLSVAAHPQDPDEVAMIWTHIDQVPNPLTFAPLGTELRFAVRDDDGWATTAVVVDTGADQLIVNPRLGRLPGGGYVAVFDQGALADLPAAQLGLAGAPLPLYATRSSDGTSWSAPVAIGVGEFILAEDPEGDSSARVISSKPDLAVGPGGMVAAVWVEAARNTVRLAFSGDAGLSWTEPEDTVELNGPGIEPAVAFDRRGNLGIFYYDAYSDTVRDDAWMIQPRFAMRKPGSSRWRDIALSRPFDARLTESCEPTCESHASALGVQQDVEGLRNGFGVGYTVGPPGAVDGRTDAVYARVRPR